MSLWISHIPRAETKAADLSGVSRSSESGTCKRFCSPVTLYTFHFFPTDFSKFEKRRIELLTKLSSMRRWSRKAVTSRFSSGEKFNQGSRVFIDCFLYERTLEAGEYENKPRVISALWANTGSTSILLHTLIFILKQQIIRSLQSIYQSHLRRSSPCTRSLNLFQSNVPDSLHACSGPLLVREGLLYQANLIFVTTITTAGCKIVQLECKKKCFALCVKF